jgi:hypothetical protein
MAPDTLLAFVLGFIGGFSLAVIIVWGLIKKFISFGVMRKAEAEIDKAVNDMFDEDK